MKIGYKIAFAIKLVQVNAEIQVAKREGKPAVIVDVRVNSAVTKGGWRWIVDAHKGDGRRYIVHSDELPSAFLELELTLL
jgi:hypothetical protein